MPTSYNAATGQWWGEAPPTNGEATTYDAWAKKNNLPVTPPTTGPVAIGEYQKLLSSGQFGPVHDISGPVDSSVIPTTQSPIAPPLAPSPTPTQPPAMSFADPGTSFIPFQAQPMAQPQIFPSTNMQSFNYPPSVPTARGNKNWWEMEW